MSAANAYLCLVTWPDGTVGLLFPRPGNVPLDTTEQQGRQNFAIACTHLKQHGEMMKEHGDGWKVDGIKIDLVAFHRLATIDTMIYTV